MNFLAHCYLSGPDPQIITGNFIGDFVKGRNLAAIFGAGIARGVELHRAIDAFTDHHPIVKESKNRLRPTYRHYSGVIVDIFYDHFLAAGWETYSEIPLEDYASRVYQIMRDQQSLLPERVNQMLPYMVRGNWLRNYAHLDGIERVLGGMARRATFTSHMEHATNDLRQSYSEFKTEFDLFFPELKGHSKDWLESHPLK
jgi:acyl carrier protein phosphodiesterase